MTEPVNIGMIGCGVVMQLAYMPLAQKLKMQGKAEVVAACDLSEDKLSEVRGKFGIPRITTDYHEIMTSDDIDLVLVLASMKEHAELTRAALEAGKHVLVEKPMATTLEEAAELMELARNSAGILLPAPHVILSPTYQTLWRRIHRGDIGKVVSARARYGWAGPWWGQWFYKQGGGSLFDLGVYNIVTLTGIIGPAKRVMAMSGVAVPRRKVEGEMIDVESEDNVHLLLDFGEAVYGVVTTGFNLQKYRSPAVEFYGTEGTIQMMGDDWDPDGYELWQNEVGAWQVYEETDPSWPWTDGLRHFVECIQEGRKPIIPMDQAYHVIEIILKAQESGRDGQAKPIESTFEPVRFTEAEEAKEAHLRHDRSHS